jgi:hypothetical protein
MILYRAFSEPPERDVERAKMQARTKLEDLILIIVFY